MFRYVTIILLVTNLWGCKQPGSKPEILQPPPYIQKAYQPENALAIDENTKARILSIKYLRELYPVERVVRLEVGEDSMISEISDCIHLDKAFYVLDFVQGRVYKFDENGSFIQQISRRGQGPGEFQNPSSIRACYGGNLAIYDGTTGKISIYTPRGVFVRSTSQIIDHLTIIPRHGFSWREQGRLILGNFRSSNLSASDNIIIDASSETMHVLNAFGMRSPYEYKLKRRWMGECLEEISQTIWVGSQYRS